VRWGMRQTRPLRRQSSGDGEGERDGGEHPGGDEDLEHEEERYALRDRGGPGAGVDAAQRQQLVLAFPQFFYPQYDRIYRKAWRR
jgi:hypothetical protein